MEDQSGRLRRDSLHGSFTSNQPQDNTPTFLPTTPCLPPESVYYENLMTAMDTPLNLVTGDPSLVSSAIWPPSYGMPNSSSLGLDVVADRGDDTNPYQGFTDWSRQMSAADGNEAVFPGPLTHDQHGLGMFTPIATSYPDDTDPTVPSASCPAAEELLNSGLFNSPYARHNSDGVLIDNFDFNQPTAVGQSLYADAMTQWSSQSGSQSLPQSPPYDPFTSRDVFHSTPSSGGESPVAGDFKSVILDQNDSFHLHGAPHNTNVPSNIPPARPQPSPVNIPAPLLNHAQKSLPTQQPTRPTYSDIAKHSSKPAQATGKASDEKFKLQKDNYHFKDAPSPHQPGKGPGNCPRYRAPAHRKSRTCATSKSKSFDIQPPTIRPDSSYGLDTFEDPITKKADSSSQLTNDRTDCGCDADTHGVAGLDSDTSNEKLFPPLYSTSETSNLFPDSKENSKEKTFFDPKRIFASKKVKKNDPVTPSSTHHSCIPNNQQRIPKKSFSDGMLNNGKPKSSFNVAGNNFDQACYINNDLRDSNKKRNNAEVQHMSGTKAQEPQTQSEASSKSSSSSTSKRKHEQDKKNEEFPLTSSSHKAARARKQRSLSAWWSYCWVWLRWAIPELISILWHNVFKTAVGLILLLLLIVLQYSYKIGRWMWRFVRDRLQAVGWMSSDTSAHTNSKPARIHGLQENITLPSTGEEAMKRLLACKGKDPYSILGVRSDSSEDEIKRYYRKQAVLVHPDKNQQPGAEEAFKILGHAFEHVGEAEKRHLYDSQQVVDDANEKAMQEFSDLLTKLQDKLKEASNMMRCDHCGGKHKRIPIDRPLYAARYCDKCATRHSVREGDMWAESRMMGFLWHYYCCMEGKVYDITEWVSCQHHRFQNIQSNAHHIIYRISTDGGRQRQHSPRSNEGELEDLLSNLFHQRKYGNSQSPGADSFSPFPGGASGSQSGQSSGFGSGTSSGHKKSGSGGRRRKRKH